MKSENMVPLLIGLMVFIAVLLLTIVLMLVRSHGIEAQEAQRQEDERATEQFQKDFDYCMDQMRITGVKDMEAAAEDCYDFLTQR